MARDQVFISYSHKDKYWLEQLQTMLAPLQQQGKLKVWADTDIQPGQLWKEEIEQALVQAKIAVLLVSPDFLASPFIRNHELPSLLEAARKEGLTIIWIPLRPCLYEETVIGEYQAVYDPRTPLCTLHKAQQETALVAIAKKLMAIRPLPLSPSSPKPTSVPPSVESAAQSPSSPPSAPSILSMNPLTLLQDAIKAVPAVRYALGLGGLLAVIAIVRSLGISYQVAVIGSILVLLGMLGLVLFANAVGLPDQKQSFPALVFTWFGLIYFMAISTALFCSVFFQFPLNLTDFIYPKPPIPPPRTVITPPPSTVIISLVEAIPNKYIRGKVEGLNPEDCKNYKVLVYRLTDQWHIHPFAKNEEGMGFASINQDGTWKITAVWRGNPASRLALLLTKRTTYAPPHVPVGSDSIEGPLIAQINPIAYRIIDAPPEHI